ncbi:glycosyltransferase family 2 protein [Leptolyngbya sp. NIES-2104]|uniref:glycosyltransferase family 2 protein n=1 Tax=Leptolyngbya sp. NIES-2104 TaxID=1552121 RepID=UPI0006EC7EBC|nr:glycosyltransferase [Leptolyngbya sp. NIES-2104]GAP96217.1 glycosyl transferase, family 2 [Leptolyngbya sp. NIES-2104]
MPYSIHEIEVTQPLPTLTLSERDTGVGLIVRRYDRAIGFLMQPWDQPQIDADTIASWIAQKLSAKILQEAIRDEGESLEISHRPSLTVAICTKDRPEQLARCLNSLLKVQSDQVEIVVIDNAPSDDRTQKLVATLPTVRYVQEPKAGLNFARNRALEVANTELLAFLDDDVVVDRLWLDGLITAWAENPDAAAWTGLVLPYELETESQILFESRGGFGRGFEKIRYGQILPGNSLYPCGAGIFGAGCNMAFRRDILLKLDGFDEALDTGAPLPGGGDLDIFYRIIRSNNVLVYEPQYLVYHQHRRESEKLRRQYWSWGLGLMAFVAKSYQSDPSQRSQFQGLVKWWFQYQSKQLIKSWFGRHPLPATMILAEMWGGIRGLLGEYPRSQQRIEEIRRQSV